MNTTITPEIRKAAVDALYEARNSGLVMDDAAAFVASAVAPLILAAERKRITDSLTGRLTP